MKGFLRTRTEPWVRSASAFAAGSFLAAVRTTGIFWVLGIALRQWHVSTPLSWGIETSMMIRSTLRVRASCSAVRPSVAETTRKPAFSSALAERFEGYGVVVGDHDGCSAVHGARFYTHFTSWATVMCDTLVSDAAGWMGYTQLRVEDTNVGHER